MRRNQPPDELISEIAWLYYVRGQTQSDIAKEKNLSRPTVISYLKQARERGYVSIRLDPVFCRMHELSDALHSAFALETVHVVPTMAEGPSEHLRAVCEVAANVLPTLLQPKDVLGVSWGESVSIVADLVPHVPVEGLVVRQLIGSMANALVETSESCTIEIARQLGGKCINLNSPAVCTSAELAAGLRREPIISEQLGALKRCNKSIFSVSACTPDTHIVQFQLASPRDIDRYVDLGANCVLAGRFLDAEGQIVRGHLDERLIGIELEDMREMDGILVASGVSKAESTLSALRGGFVHDLVVDADLASCVLELHNQA